MVVSPKGTDEEEELVRRAGAEVDRFVRKRWDEDVWETAWFVNPPVSFLSSSKIVVMYGMGF